MTERELLEYAAKAVGLVPTGYVSYFGLVVYDPSNGTDNNRFNPLKDDGDALRLAVKLNMGVCQDSSFGHVSADGLIEDYNGDPYAATRRAIVRAAAESGKGM